MRYVGIFIAIAEVTRRELTTLWDGMFCERGKTRTHRQIGLEIPWYGDPKTFVVRGSCEMRRLAHSLVGRFFLVCAPSSYFFHHSTYGCNIGACANASKFQ
jgi:hypothetical protein